MNTIIGIEFVIGLVLTAVIVAGFVLGSGLMLYLVRRNTRHIHHARAWYVQLLSVAVFLFGLILLHGVAIIGFAIAYLGLGVFSDAETALYFSSAAYSTLGHADLAPLQWRLLGVWEGLVGIVLVGWSTALLLSVILRIWSENHRWFDPRD